VILQAKVKRLNRRSNLAVNSGGGIMVRKFFYPLFIGFFLVASCAGKNLIKSTTPPNWVDKLPVQKGILCAVGYSGPTFYQQDCLSNAADHGRGLLAETISATIRMVTIDISDGTRGYFSRDVFVQGSETVSQAVLRGSEIQAQWMDMTGQRGSAKGCFSMVCIDPDKPIDSFVESLEEKLPAKTVEQVRENATAAFDELEKEEQKATTAKDTLPKDEEDSE
jgi:hypothetical protein